MAAEDDTQTCRAEMSDHGAIDLRWDAPFELKTKTDEHLRHHRVQSLWQESARR